MPRVEVAELLAAGCHFGHLTRRWNPKMRPYIFMERNGIHIIDLVKTTHLLEDACNAIANMIAEGKRVLFVGTKKQAKEIIKVEAVRTNQFWIHAPSDRTDQQITARAASMLARTNPTYLRAVPG